MTAYFLTAKKFQSEEFSHKDFESVEGVQFSVVLQV
jgi:hypothetical protein